MTPTGSEFCDVSLPVPMGRAFTYRLPLTLRHRVQPGSRLLVPFGTRKLTGIVLRCHDDPPEVTAREVMRLLDEEPVLGEEMLRLGRWVAEYYSAPLGEVLRTMTPLSGEMHRGKVYSLTDAGRDAAKQLFIAATGEDPQALILRMLEPRPLTASWLKKKVPEATNAIRALLRKGFIEAEEIHTARDPARAKSERLRVEFVSRPEDVKLKKAERELIAYLELHPGSHNLGAIASLVKNSSQAARALARRGLVNLRLEGPKIHPAPDAAAFVLNSHQQNAFDKIIEAVRAREFRTFLLRGVTGSGKTEIYLRAIEVALAQALGVLLLVPEIALTPAMAGQFYQRFGDRVAILHSAFTDRERAEQWRRIRSGEAGVVVGTRSGVFAPVKNLGLIVVDEEHDHSYKQGESPRYNGRDVAIVRAQQAGACVVLGSATPALESRYNAQRGRYHLIELPERIYRRPLPHVELIDMREEFLETREQNTFSRRLLEAIGGRLERGEQTMLLMNRRGFSSFIACRSCGERVICDNCAVTLTYHRRDQRLLCHYCNHAAPVPKKCPSCQSEYIYFVGRGSERVEDELHRHFPEARIARLDRDTVTSKKAFENILYGFRSREYDILVGTQMIAKGHDIPNVTLVGVVSADIGLGMPDFRAAERTFQLLTQAAGRAGRGDLPGEVIVQTINPGHYAIRSAVSQDYERFYEKELQFRRLMRYPPFSALANILVRAATPEQAAGMAAELAALLDPPPPELRVLGPAEAPVPKLKREFRNQLLIKASSRKILRERLSQIRSHAVNHEWSPTALVVDVDPLSLL